MDQNKPTRKRGSGAPKIKFVMDQPLDMPAAEVSAKAKEAGLEIKPGYVHTIRSAAKTAKQGAAKAVGVAPALEAQKPAKAPRGRKPQKAAKAKLQQVAKAPVAPKKPSRQPARVRVQKPVAQKRVDAPSSEVLLRKLVLELGLKRSRELLDEVDRRLQELIAGK